MNKQQIKYHFHYPYIFIVIIVLLFEVLQLDLLIADWIYQQEGYSWILKDSFFLNTVMHDWARLLFNYLAGLLILRIIIYALLSNTSEWSSALYLFLSIFLTVVLVALLKKWTNVGCPWHYTRYGGEDSYVPIFYFISGFSSKHACFPAGHASGGYAWVSLYFYFLFINPKFRWLGLFVGLIFGFSLDVAQQFRGAHFASHGIWTLGIAWVVSSSLYLVTKKQINKRISDDK